MKAPLYTMSAGELGLENTRRRKEAFGHSRDGDHVECHFCLLTKPISSWSNEALTILRRNELVSSKSHSLCPSYSD